MIQGKETSSGPCRVALEQRYTWVSFLDRLELATHHWIELCLEPPCQKHDSAVYKLADSEVWLQMYPAPKRLL